MSDDFFSNVPRRRSTPEHDAHDDFAHAISVRFGSTDLRTARLLPDDLPANHPATPVPTALSHPPPPPPPRPPSPPQTFASVPPAALAPYLADPRALILDIRPHAAHTAARINNALSLSVPTTLLKRPLFSLSKLSQMLPSPSSRARFADWSSASRILVYDSDSTSSPDNSIIAGLLRKFRAEGFAGELGWVRGGFQAVWREVRDLTTTEPPSPEEDDPDPASSSGTLRTTHLPKAAFSLLSTTAAPHPQLGTVPGSNPLPNTPAPSASRAANPFFDAIRQNVELSHGITERIPLHLPRRVRRRIPDLPSRWLQEIARRSALRRSSTSRHPGLDSLESGSESSDDPHTSDPDENDPDVEEGTEALAMQFYRIELAEQRRLRSIMEHHTRESQVSGFTTWVKPRRTPEKDDGACVRTGAKSVPETPHPAAFPFSITAAVEKGTKNRYTHIWPFEHARVRLHDGRHQGSHLGRRERGRSARDRTGGKIREMEEQEQDKQRRSRSSPAIGKTQGQEVTEVVGASSRHSFYFDARSSISDTGVGFEAGPTHPTLDSGTGVPRVKIEYDTAEQDSRMSGPPTPATALPLVTPPFYTPMEMVPAPTPMRSQPPQLLSPPSTISVSPGGTQISLPTSSLPYLGPLPSYPLRLPNRPGGLLPSIGEQTWTSESLPSPATSLNTFTGRMGTDGKAIDDSRTMRREPSPVDDYVNASYVQPLCTRKRYIATQGPLPSTYVDFWTLVWEQNVHVIVMLTREVENAMVKCGSYWTDTEYGPLRLELLSTSPPMSPSADPITTDIHKQGFFAIREPRGKTSGASRDQLALITRTFLLSHTSYPGIPPRRITHLQYLDWSDMSVPDDPQGVLDLVKKVEQAVAESSPGPSPGGSLSPGSGSGSLSGSQSPDVGPDQKGYEMSLLSPTNAGTMPREGRGRRGNAWRHPELDSKSGIAAFALGTVAPVLLHCSAGVGRTGGFIAVDAVLDGIRRELRKNREDRKLKQASRVSAVVGPESKTGVNDSAKFNVERRETGFNTMESCVEGVFDEGKCMDVDEPITDEAEKTQDLLRMINTVPIHVSAGDHTKGRRRHKHGKHPSDEKQCSSSESLVVHVPYAGTDVLEGTNVASIDLVVAKEADWQSSTREWVEKVSDQTHAHAEESLPAPALLPSSNRERSPGSTSSSSGPSALNSADDSMSGGASANASGSSGDKSGIENKVEHKSNTGSASGSGTGSGRLPSSMSKPGSGSTSISTSGSGTGTGSQFGSSLLHARLRDSSVTSISVESTDSPSPQCEHKPLHRPLAIRTGSSSDMEIDCPPRSVSVPLQLTYSNVDSPQLRVSPRYDKPILGLSPVAHFSSPILPRGTTESGISFCCSDAAEGPASRPNSDLSSDELTPPLQEFESGESASTEESRTNSREVSEELPISSKSETNLQLYTELSTMTTPETLHGGNATKSPLLASRQVKGREWAIPLATHGSDELALQQFSAASGVLGASEHDRHAADHPVIDYKLPRELHSDLSPPLISSFAEPICTVIQDMREQRMSLCQSLRQYVFVHAAIIEGALRIIDEEREFGGYSGSSDDTSSAEGEPRASVRKDERRAGQSETKTCFEGANTADVVAMRPELEHDSITHRTRPLHAMTQSLNPWSSEGKVGGGQVSLVSVSSPSKGKRAPSPTELLREDKTGAPSLNKRPSIYRKRTSDEGDQFSFESNASSPVAGENGGGLRGATLGVSATRFAVGRLAVPEKGGPTPGSAR